MNQWNPFTGDVHHIDSSIQLQTYRLPWPFSSREYLVRCRGNAHKSGHQAHCASIDGHPSAPLRSDRVRGHSETIWRFTADGDGQTSIHLETLVDPRGNVPTWVVDKLGKSAAVTIVRSLIKHASLRERRWQAAAAAGSGGAAAGDEAGFWRNFMRAGGAMGSALLSAMAAPARILGLVN